MAAIYIWPLYGFLAIKNLVVSDMLSLIHGRVGSQPFRRKLDAPVLARVAFGKLAHVAWAVVIPLMFNPWWAVLAFYAVSSWLVGFTLAMIFQLAHCIDAAEMPDADVPRRGQDFVAHQLRTTVNIASPVPVVGHMFRWIAAGSTIRSSITSRPASRTRSTRGGGTLPPRLQTHGVSYRQHSDLVSRSITRPLAPHDGPTEHLGALNSASERDTMPTKSSNQNRKTSTPSSTPPPMWTRSNRMSVLPTNSSFCAATSRPPSSGS